MPGGEFVASDQPTLWIPPRETWLHDPLRDGPLETPTDSLGRVDLDALIPLVKSTVEPDFSWRSARSDVHHLQHYERYYISELEQEFRELISHKVFVSRTFHNWLHIVTTPSDVPSEEVMRHTIQAETAKVGLARTASLAMRLTRIPDMPEYKRVQRLEEIYGQYMMYYESAQHVPPEFNHLILEELSAENVDELLTVNRRLGKLALGTIPIRHRDILQAA